MPYKARYWKNPDHHRKESNDRVKRITALGLPKRYQLSLPAQVRRLAYQSKYRKAHLKQNSGACKRWRKKVARLVGTSGVHNRWLYYMKTAEQNAKLRKSRAGPP